MYFFRSFLKILELSFKTSLAYRFSMLMSVLSFPILFFIEYFLWSAIFAASGAEVIAGFTVTEMIGYYVITLTTFVLIWTPVTNNLHEGVREGKFIMYLTKPLSFIYHNLVFTIGNRAFALLVEYTPLIVIMTLILGREFMISSNWVDYATVVIITFILNYQLQLIIGILIFFLTNPSGLNWIYRILRYLFAGGLLPLTFYPEIIQKFLMYTPFPFLAFIPSSIFVGHVSFDFIDLSMQRIIFLGISQIIILSFIIYFIWKLALKRFQGVGS